MLGVGIAIGIGIEIRNRNMVAIFAADTDTEPDSDTDDPTGFVLQRFGGFLFLRCGLRLPCQLVGSKLNRAKPEASAAAGVLRDVIGPLTRAAARSVLFQ